MNLILCRKIPREGTLKRTGCKHKQVSLISSTIMNDPKSYALAVAPREQESKHMRSGQRLSPTYVSHDLALTFVKLHGLSGFSSLLLASMLAAFSQANSYATAITIRLTNLRGTMILYGPAIGIERISSCDTVWFVIPQGSASVLINGEQKQIPTG